MANLILMLSPIQSETIIKKKCSFHKPGKYRAFIKPPFVIKTEGSPLPVTKCTCLGIALRSLFLGTILLIQPHPIIHPIFQQLPRFLPVFQTVFILSSVSLLLPFSCLNVLPSHFYQMMPTLQAQIKPHFSRSFLLLLLLFHQPGLSLAFSNTYCSHQCPFDIKSFKDFIIWLNCGLSFWGGGVGVSLNLLSISIQFTTSYPQFAKVAL